MNRYSMESIIGFLCICIKDIEGHEPLFEGGASNTEKLEAI